MQSEVADHSNILNIMIFLKKLSEKIIWQRKPKLVYQFKNIEILLIQEIK